MLMLSSGRLAAILSAHWREAGKQTPCSEALLNSDAKKMFCQAEGRWS